MLCWDWVSSLTVVSLILKMPKSQEISRDLQQRMPGFRGGHCDQDILSSHILVKTDVFVAWQMKYDFQLSRALPACAVFKWQLCTWRRGIKRFLGIATLLFRYFSLFQVSLSSGSKLWFWVFIHYCYLSTVIWFPTEYWQQVFLNLLKIGLFILNL